MKTNSRVGMMVLGILSLLSTTVLAQTANDSVQAVAHLTINGVEATQVMAEISFNGTNIYVAYADGTVATFGTNDLLVLTFEGGKMPPVVPPTYPDDPVNPGTGLEDMRLLEFGGIVGDELMLGGVADGTMIRIYNLQGMLMIDTTYSSDKSINVSTMPAGIYLLQAGKDVVKFKK